MNTYYVVQSKYQQNPWRDVSIWNSREAAVKAWGQVRSTQRYSYFRHARIIKRTEEDVTYAQEA